MNGGPRVQSGTSVTVSDSGRPDDPAVTGPGQSQPRAPEASCLGRLDTTSDWPPDNDAMRPGPETHSLLTASPAHPESTHVVHFVHLLFDACRSPFDCRSDQRNKTPAARPPSPPTQ
ncbi:hypothetical protein VTJ04DRAFT_6130 [Mycothermus thermophilus]|uniref:uncharacterized protein n=1 Tax=Humicola insolens TaxID=85995 RepID=UPI003742E3F6